MSKPRVYTFNNSNGVMAQKDFDQQVGQLDRWAIGFRSGNNFFHVQSDSLFQVVRVAYSSYKNLMRSFNG